LTADFVSLLLSRIRANLFVANNLLTSNRTAWDVVLATMTKMKSVFSLTLNTSLNNHFVLLITQNALQLLKLKLYLIAICGDACCVLPSRDSKALQDTGHN